MARLYVRNCFQQKLLRFEVMFQSWICTAFKCFNLVSQSACAWWNVIGCLQSCQMLMTNMKVSNMDKLKRLFTKFSEWIKTPSVSWCLKTIDRTHADVCFTWNDERMRCGLLVLMSLNRLSSAYKLDLFLCLWHCQVFLERKTLLN